MFERFTERARRVVVLAQEEARMLDHNYIGTEHILLGLIHEGDGVAARVIGLMGLTIEAARDQVEQMIGRGSAAPSGHIPFTPRAKKVLELSLREALELNKSYIGTEHILLGLIREGHGVGAQILELLAGPLSAVRETAVGLTDSEPQEPDSDEPVAMATSSSFSLPRGRGPERDIRMGERDARMRMMVETVVEFREAIESIRRRLAAIERHLGIDGEQAKAEAADAAEAAEAAAPEDQPLA
jgi:ATP-dependent Clp protease ATP-binding subunit ClpC